MYIVILADDAAIRIRDFDTIAPSQSHFLTRQVDPEKPTWFDGRYMQTIVEDETSYFQYGQFKETEFWEFTLSPAKPSSWMYWPTPESPTNRYKYVSGEFNVSLS